jgi:hypothetical protein
VRVGLGRLSAEVDQAEAQHAELVKFREERQLQRRTGGA